MTSAHNMADPVPSKIFPLTASKKETRQIFHSTVNKCQSTTNSCSVISQGHVSVWDNIPMSIFLVALYILNLFLLSVTLTSPCLVQPMLIQGVPGGKSIFCEAIVSVILSKRKCICTCVLFRTVSKINLFLCTVHCTLYRRAKSHVFKRATNCIDVDRGTLEQ
jgi:hypothetical protein